MAVSPRRRTTDRRGPPGDLPSGRFVLRLPAALHASLQGAARAAGVSLNEYCVRRLAAPGAGLALLPDAAALVRRAAEVAGDALIGVVLHGSWARGEAARTSDVDVLIVIERRLALSRALYRTWDEAVPSWEGRRVDPHFAHPPDDGPTGGLWGEVATDGIVLVERDLEISAILVRTRRDIAAGRLVRRIVHGQPYWTAVA
jgi:predicted nucleotidyltransferase